MQQQRGVVVWVPREGDNGLGSRVEVANVWDEFEDTLERGGVSIAYVDDVRSPLLSGAFVGGFEGGGRAALRLGATSDVGGVFALLGELSETDRSLVASVPVPVKVFEDDTDDSQLRALATWILERLPAAPPQRQDDDESSGQEETPPPVVAYSLVVEENAEEDVVAVFSVPPGCEELVSRFPVHCRGGSFAVEAAETGKVRSRFRSPAPHATAAAIALRLQARLESGGGGDVAACPLS